jgi:hypothetical protein
MRNMRSRYSSYPARYVHRLFALLACAFLVVAMLVYLPQAGGTENSAASDRS